MVTIRARHSNKFLKMGLQLNKDDALTIVQHKTYDKETGDGIFKFLSWSYTLNENNIYINDPISE